MSLTAPAIPASGVAAANPTGQDANVVWAGGTVQALVATSPLLPSTAIAPAVPATTVPATNTTGVSQLVAITASGATITAVTINGTGVGTAAGQYIVPAAGTIAISYTGGPPTWAWTAIAWGAAGNGGNLTAGAVAVRVPPGGSAICVYSVVPTSWTWMNPLDTADEPEVGSENLVLINELGQLPYPAHTEGGEPGLGAGVSN
jgi:hypothetical protein